MKVVLSLTLLLLELTTCVYSETCPSKEDISPCTCVTHAHFDDYIDFACTDDLFDLEDLQKILKSLIGKENVQMRLENLCLGKVPSDMFSGIGVKLLSIINCQVESSEDGKPALSGLEDTLEWLQIYHLPGDNVISQLKLGHLNKLLQLGIMYTTITELSNDFFEDGPTSLQYLDLPYNEIEKLGDKAFANLLNLKHLNVNGNLFGLVQRSMFPSPAYSLRKLELEDNGINDLPQDIFTDMPSLDHVSLIGNGIMNLDEGTWKAVWEQLTILNIAENPLHCDFQMNWMFNLRAPSTLEGTCEAPEDQQGKNLKDFINNGNE